MYALNIYFYKYSQQSAFFFESFAHLKENWETHAAVWHGGLQPQKLSKVLFLKMFKFNWDVDGYLYYAYLHGMAVSP